MNFVFSPRFIPYQRPFDVVTWYVKDGIHLVSSAQAPPDGSITFSNIFLIIAFASVGILYCVYRMVKDGEAVRNIREGIAKAPSGRVLSLTYKGNPTEVIVGPNIPIVTYAPGNPGMLLPGKAVFVIALKKDDGSLSASQVTVESHGVKPPM